MARTPSTTTAAPTTQAAPAQRRSGGPALNRVELIGRIASDVELRYTSSGLPVCTLRIATNDRETDHRGGRRKPSPLFPSAQREGRGHRQCRVAKCTDDV